MSNDQNSFRGDSPCIPIPVGSPNPIIWHMDIGDRLKIQNLKYGANQQVYATCGPQVADTCGNVNIKRVTYDPRTGEVTTKGTLFSGARIPISHMDQKNTMYKKIDLVCK